MAAEPTLEPGSWRVKISSTANGAPQPDQDSIQCLGDELKDIGKYFMPVFEGAEVRCSHSRKRAKDPGTIDYRMRCTGNGFTVSADTVMVAENPRRFSGTVRMLTKTRKESALVLARMEATRTGQCSAAAPPK